jgi:hypothetical protein
MTGVVILLVHGKISLGMKNGGAVKICVKTRPDKVVEALGEVREERRDRI